MVSEKLQVNLQGTIGSFQLAVDFTVPLSLIVLLGPSAAGKSTVLDCLAGLRSDCQGKITVAGEKFFDSAARINLPPQKRRLGYVFQRPNLFPHLSVLDNISFGIQNWEPKRRSSRLEYLVELLQLGPLCARRIEGLSGGESQRVALARAIAAEPRLLLLDEPFSALHTNMRSELGEQLRLLRQQLSLPMVLVTHSRQEALALGEIVVCLAAGSVTEVGPVDQVVLEQPDCELNDDVCFSW